MATGVDHFGAIGPLWWVLGCLWGAFGVLLGRLWGPKRRPGRPQGGSQGHLGVQRASGRVLGSFWGWFWCRKRDILRCQNLKILLAGPMKSQYFGFWTLETKMDDFGSKTQENMRFLEGFARSKEPFSDALGCCGGTFGSTWGTLGGPWWAHAYPRAQNLISE